MCAPIFVLDNSNSAGFKSLTHANTQVLALHFSLSLSLSMPLTLVVPPGVRKFSIANNAARIAFIALLWLAMLCACSGVFGVEKSAAQYKYIKRSALKAAKQLLCWYLVHKYYYF